jgi:predicted helicase
VKGTGWEDVVPASDGSWRLDKDRYAWDDFLSVANKTDKAKAPGLAETIFQTFSAGCKTNRDPWTFNYSAGVLETDIVRSVDFYNRSLSALPARKMKKAELVKLVPTDDREIAWSDDLRASLARREQAQFDQSHIRQAASRPFTVQYLYFDRLFNDRVLLNPRFFGEPGDSLKNLAIGITSHSQVPFSTLAVSRIASHDFGGRPTQFVPFFVYDKNGTKCRENITDWALSKFRTHYADDTITKWDIFHATYAGLHHPEYRTRYAANLKRELPRIPFPPDFHAFAAAGKRLMELHIDYEKQPEYVLEQIEDPKAEVSFRVDRMKLSKDKSELRYNDFLLLRGIPAAAFDYRLGNRSALEWVIDQYRVSTDPRSGIVNDPNRPDDPKYILRLIGQVITVSLETQRTIATLPSLNFGE